MEQNKASLFMGIFLLSLLIIEWLFGLYLKKRQGFWLKYVICTIIILLYSIFMPLTGDDIYHWILIPLSIFTLTLFMMKICYDERFSVILFIGIASYTIQHISAASNSLISMLNPVRFEHLYSLGHLPSILMLIAVCNIITNTICYFAFIRKMNGIDKIQMSTPSLLMLTGTIVLINEVWGPLFNSYSTAGPTDWERGSQYLWNIVSCILCLCLMFGIFSKNKVTMELDFIKQLSSGKEKQYQISKSTIDAINMKCHNLKYQLSQLEIEKNSEQLLQNTYELIDTFDSEIKTNNEILDVIFTEKNSYCRLRKISFVCMIDGSKLNFMDVADIYVLFGNIIDNAIQAVSEISTTAERSIYIDVHSENKLLHISTENCYQGEIQFNEGLPETRTKDFINHGYGMKTIKMICQKYGGNISTKTKGNTFYLNIIIPL